MDLYEMGSEVLVKQSLPQKAEMTEEDFAKIVETTVPIGDRPVSSAILGTCAGCSACGAQYNAS